MSPEQCHGEEVDARSDVYALGCVFYEMLTGRPPFVAPNLAALIFKHVHEAPQRPSELVPEIGPSFDDALVRALAKTPDERYQTAEAFALALAAPAAGAAFSTHKAGWTTDEGHRATEVIGGVRTGTVPANNLPRTLTRFVGREEQIEEVRDWLRRARLVTLVGPGGIGKTRLALEVAEQELDDYGDGVWLVTLAALTDPALVTHAVASALGVREQGGRLEIEALVAWLREKRLLLVLDNCEHLVEACARLAQDLLEACAGLRVLATSREALGITGEAVWPVPALAVPAQGAADALDCEAVRLFLDRATLAKPTFEATATVASIAGDLCRRLEGIPLAIELAAARVKVLSVEQILARLADRFQLLAGGSRTAPSRQQTLRATLDWSYELLAGEERALLRKLSVFSGGWTLAAAEAAGDTADVLDVLTRLLDKSLVVSLDRRWEARYGMLETVREYALERLRAEGEEAGARQRHAEFFLALGEAAAPELDRPKRAEWFERLEAEHDNVRGALEWLLGNDAEACLRLATAFWGFWNVYGDMTEGRRWLGAALDAARQAPAQVRMKALFKGGVLAQLQGDLATARAYFAEGKQVSKEAGDEQQVAWFGLNLGFVAFAERDIATARALIEEGLSAARVLGDERLAMGALNALGELERLSCNWPEARRLYEQARTMAEQAGEQFAISMYLCNLGAVTYAEDDLSTARSYYREALTMDRELGYRANIGYSLDGLAAVAVKEGAWERAGRLAGAAQALRDAIGYELEPVDLAFRDSYMAEARGHLGHAAFEAALAEGRAMTQEQAVDYALST
jgi:non-specific serine/threonine protein kinase